MKRMKISDTSEKRRSRIRRMTKDLHMSTKGAVKMKK